MVRALIIISLLLGSCTHQQNSQVDPKAFSLWVVPF